MEQPTFELIERYLKGLVNEQEKLAVESLFMHGENNDELKHLLEKEWEATHEDPDAKVNIEMLLDRIHHIMHNREIAERQSPIKRFIRLYSKAAAILLLPLLIAGGLLYLRSANHADTSSGNFLSTAEIYAPLGSRVSFTLPDGTAGMLNSGSRISYALPFDNNRHVSLTGESWFEVKKDKEHPFIIDVGNASVKVLGTSFNVSAYPDESYVEIVLQHGKVEFQENSGKHRVLLLPSERLVYQDGKTIKAETDPEKYCGWTRGQLIFRGDPMIEVARRIERWYNVKIVLADKEIEKYSYRATFEDDNLDDVFRFLSMTSPITYVITPGKINPDGSYQKKIITISLKE